MNKKTDTPAEAPAEAPAKAAEETAKKPVATAADKKAQANGRAATQQALAGRRPLPQVGDTSINMEMVAKPKYYCTIPDDAEAVLQINWELCEQMSEWLLAERLKPATKQEIPLQWMMAHAMVCVRDGDFEEI